MTGEVYHSSTAPEDIKNMINAMAEAQKANIDVKKEVLGMQIKNKMELAQKGQEQLQTKNINYNYEPGGNNSLESLNNPIQTPVATPMGGVLNPAAGTADSGTPAALGAPPVGVQGGSPMASVLNPAAPPSKVLTAPTQPNAGIQGQPIVPPGTTQAPTKPVLNSPAAGLGGQPIMPPSVQYNNLGYKPIEAQQLVQARRSAGQTINSADVSYAQALQKVKTGTATQGEVDMVHKMNNKTPEGNAIPPAGQPAVGGTVPSSSDTKLRNMEQKLGYPEGSLWRNPETMAPELSPIWKAKMEATQRAQANYDVTHPYMEDKRQDALENRYADRVSKLVQFRSGGLGVQDAKVNSGVHALALLDQTYDPTTKTFNIPPIMQSELAANVNNAISNQNVTSDQMRQDLQQRSIYGDWNKTMQYILNTPKNSLPQDNAKLLASMVIRQGPVAEMERDKYMSDLKTLVPSELDKDRAEKINAIQFGTSFNAQLAKTQFYKDLFANDPKYKDMMGGSSAAGGATSGAVKNFNSEAEAAAAGLPDGTRVTINGQSGTWRN